MPPPLPSVSTQRISQLAIRCASQSLLTWLSRPEKPPMATTFTPLITASDAPCWLETAMVPPPFDCTYAAAWVRLEFPPNGPPPPAKPVGPTAGNPAPVRPSPPKPPAPTLPPGPPNPALCDPPEGNVPLVGWPSVWNDHAAGAASNATAAATMHALRMRGPTSPARTRAAVNGARKDT